MNKLKIGDKVVTTYGYTGIITEFSKFEDVNIINCGHVFFEEKFIDKKGTKKANMHYIDISKDFEGIKLGNYAITCKYGIIVISENINYISSIASLNLYNIKDTKKINKFLNLFGFFCIK